MKTLKYLALLILILPFLFSCEDTSTELRTVATPVISPAGGTYTAAQNVTITCETDAAVIRYTTDGTAPDENSTLYSTPITVNANVTIKAFAYKVGWNDSNVATATFMIYDNMVEIPAGTFTMGRTASSGLTEYADELPTHQVTLNRFYMGKYEVTQAEWLAVMGSNPSHFTGDNTRPVEMVNWYSTLVYCNKKSINEGLTPVYTINGSTNPDNWGSVPTTDNATWNAASANLSANGYRLPTEAEWEYAARGATNTPDYIYAGGNTLNTVSWNPTNAGGTTKPVGGKAANGLGLFDMSGNVQEWCWDWYGSTYYNSSPANNPTGPATGTVRVIRGGSWDKPATIHRVACRNWGTPNKGEAKVINNELGFRVVRTAD